VAPEGADQLQNIANMLVFLSEHVGCLAVMWAPAISQSVTHRGLAALMSQPEFRETAAALPLIQLLENYGELVALLREVLEISGLHIRIGTENADSQLYSFSMVASRVDIDAHSAVVAVFGPTRMDYRKAIASVSAVVDGYKH
jgi:heat-inducible transcriptional repressor